MNSLNLLSSRVIGQTPLVTRPRSQSQGEILRSKLSEELLRGRSHSEEKLATLANQHNAKIEQRPDINSPDDSSTSSQREDDERQPLLNDHGSTDSPGYASGLRLLIKRITDALTAILSTIGIPVVYVARCFQDEDGHYSPLVPFRRRKKRRTTQKTRPPAIMVGSVTQNSSEKALQISPSTESFSSSASESEDDQKQSKQAGGAKINLGQGTNGRRKSPRVKLMHNDEAAQRRHKGGLVEQSKKGDAPLTVDSLKSPISTATSLKATRYPHAPQPPRPLIPRRQPSYANLVPRLSSRIAPPSQQKTLVLDLDETLIHSLAKGGRMSTGHMVEVKLNVPVVVSPPQTGHQPPAVIGPQHPILYYVHKRPHCDEFLRKICKWYKLVVFTASVQEYADPVIDWLEQERKYFHGRYYRQHCTFRNGSYIKDLSSIEPDLSKVMILDNSPVSYIFHEDNAIPIEGWINDPTDNDLLHLIPMLEALQYATDVRALLALRRGEAEAASA